MLFSIITVTYNAAATLPVTLESIVAQTFRDFEFILIDGASIDNTVLLADRTPIKNRIIMSGPDEGIYDAMNHGLQLAGGEYVIFLNAGDSFAAPDTLQTYADAIASAAPVRPGIVYGQTLLVDSERRPLGPRHLTAPKRLTLRSFANGMVVCHQAMAVRRDLAPQYDMRYRFSADYDWCVRVLQRSPLNVYTGAVTAHYLSEGLTTANHHESLRERFDIMTRHYGRIPTTLRHLKFALRSLLRSLRKAPHSSK